LNLQAISGIIWDGLNLNIRLKMKLKNKVEIWFPGVDKVHASADSDCPIGQVFDYACALKSFCIQRMKEDEEAQKKQAEEIKSDQ